MLAGVEPWHDRRCTIRSTQWASIPIAGLLRTEPRGGVPRTSILKRKVRWPSALALAPSRPSRDPGRVERTEFPDGGCKSVTGAASVGGAAPVANGAHASD